MIDEYNKLNNCLKDKKILYIPIYSCFDYITKQLNFKSDGNINRFLTTFANLDKYYSIDIVCPENGNNIDWFISSFNKIIKNGKLIKSKYIVESAKVQRNIDFAKNIFNDINLSDYDLVIAEGQYVVLELLDNHKNLDVVYWCPVCATDNKTRDFLEPNKSLDKYIFSRVNTTIFASKDQVDYIKSLQSNSNIKYTDIILIETLINRNLNIFDYKPDWNLINTLNPYQTDYTIFYLPFRLTDIGYKLDEILESFEKVINKKIIVLYSNPNNCNVLNLAKNDIQKQFIQKHFIKVSLNRDVYYTILDYIVCYIPYFEDTDFINHAAISEFKTSMKCKVLRNKNELKDFLKILD